MDFNLLVLASFEVITMTTMDSQEPACCYNATYLIRRILEAPNLAEDGTN